MKKQSSSTTVPKIDRNLLCNQLNAFKNDLVEEEAKQNYAFGMKSLEKDKEQIGKLAFRDQSDIPIPVTPEVTSIIVTLSGLQNLLFYFYFKGHREIKIVL